MTRRAEHPLQELRGGVWPVLDAESERLRRERIAGRVMQVQRQLSERAGRRRRHGFGVALAALLFGVCLLVVLGRGAGDGSVARGTVAQGIAAIDAVRLVAGHASLKSDGVPLAYGQFDVSAEPTIVTRAEEGAEFRLSSETALNVSPSSEVGIIRRHAEAGTFEELLRLRAGGVALEVPKLGKRGKVLVETRDALVEVHGTKFSVRVIERPPLAAFTQVEVREGRVSVRSAGTNYFVSAGESWSSNREPAAHDSEPMLPAAPAVPDELPTKHVLAPRSLPKAEIPAAVASELAAQNRLIEAAELAQRSGMPGLALERLDTLIARYPDAELAHNARVERFRLLNGMGRKQEAAVAARQYLALYPRGFASAEAQQLLEASEGQRP
jgi:ferric-dicitrate binding protein FerR (iron transport regulator)